MLTQKSGAAPQGRPTVGTVPPGTVLPPLYTMGGGMSRGELEELLTAMWNEPVSIAEGHIGGHGPAYYARSESNWMGLELGASGFTPMWKTAESDHHEYNDARYAASRGMA